MTGPTLILRHAQHEGIDDPGLTLSLSKGEALIRRKEM
tara:strand:- start:7278 stop:7391 length:114 start_codon:yes stop_codon:yes gene_type:complete